MQQPEKVESVKRSQPVWHPPSSGGLDLGLRVANSLALEAGLVPFVPNKGRRVGWYICGPTTYDASHLGHARNYVTFDVIRRILTEHFNYDLFCVMNITDVDDKIILKARREMLFQQYAAANAVISPEVLSFVRVSLDQEVVSCEKKIGETEADMDKNENERTGEVRLLKRRIEASAALLAKVSSFKEGDSSKELLSAAEAAVSVALDAKLKESVGNLDVRPLASRYEKEFLEDMKVLGVRMPDVLTRVSEYIPEIIAYVERIIKNGYGYESNGSVYFDTVKYSTDGAHEYGKLAPSKVGNARAQEEADGPLTAAKTDKKNASDFVLWKKSKKGEPVWDSPWGLGRPGWHIECSAMASELLGETLDIHGGGQDLYFPHHENEIAQCEAFFHHNGCKQWVNYFFHSGHLHIDGLKMAKSLKNFITIREALKPPHNYTPRQLRLFFVTRPWNKEVNFERKTMEEVFAMERAFDSFFAAIASVGRSFDSQAVRQAWTPADVQLNEHIVATSDAVHSAFCSNFDTRVAVTSLLALAKSVNLYLEASGNKYFLLQKAARVVARTLGVLGLTGSTEVNDWNAGSAASTTNDDSLVQAFYDFRQVVRGIATAKEGDVKAALLQATDDLRDRVLPPLGLKFDDAKLGWKRVDSSKAVQEIAERRQLEREKLMKRIAAAEQDVAVLERGSKPPSSVLDLEEFGAFDGDGYPTAMKDGSEIPKSRQKTLKKAWTAQDTAHKKFLAKSKGEGETLLAEARGKVEALKRELEQLP